MIGPCSGTFSDPCTSIRLKKVVIAELASETSGGCVNPNGMLGVSEPDGGARERCGQDGIFVGFQGLRDFSE